MHRFALHASGLAVVMLTGVLVSASTTGVASAAEPAGFHQNFHTLQSVAAVSASDVWAVGEIDGSAERSLVKHFDGSHWTTVASPNPGGTHGTHLGSVAASSADDVWAVGHYGTTTGTRPLIVHWDGSSWTVTASPTVDGELNGVTVLSRDNAWAVGTKTVSGKPLMLVEHWNGTAWSLVSAPSLKVPAQDGYNQLDAVSALTAGNVWAVGAAGSPAGAVTVTEHWTGSRWSLVKSPSPEPPGYHAEDFLTGVVVTAAGDVWADGGWVTAEGGDGRGFILHWNGHAWSKSYATRQKLDMPTWLQAIDSVGPNDVWAVGLTDAGQGNAVSVHWDGSAWQPVRARSPHGDSELEAVSALSTDDVWAVGQSIPPGGEAALVENWNGSSWSISR